MKLVIAFIALACIAIAPAKADENPCHGKTPIEVVQCQGPMPVSKFIVIENNDGGNILQFSSWFATLYQSGISVHIRGECKSACTMVLALGAQACLESGAKLGFHAASIGDKFNADATLFLANNYYPANIRAWYLGVLVAREKRGQNLREIFWATDKELIASGTMKPCI